MMRKLSLVALIVLTLASPAFALDTSTQRLLTHAWPGAPARRVSEIGRGIGVVFSPDLSVKNNCSFYQALGFACFQEADWEKVLDQVHRYNVLYPERRIMTLVLETHGTNGNGLKLQESYDPAAGRSYISVGALQERLEPEGIYYVIISACNSGRLLRPSIYNKLDRSCTDKLFLPATNGIVDASDDFDGYRSPVMIITPQSSHIETTLVGTIAELRPSVRRTLTAAAKRAGVKLPKEFAVSDMMVQMITRDGHLQLGSGSYVEQLSREIRPEASSEQLFKRFVTYLNAVTARESSVKLAKAKKPAPKHPARTTASVTPSGAHTTAAPKAASNAPR